MLTITQHPNSHYYCTANIQTSYYGKSESFKPLIGPFSPYTATMSLPALVYKKDGWISKQGKMNIVGDRPCDHRQISGDISIVPFRTYPYETTEVFFDYRYFEYGTKKAVFTHVIPPDGYLYTVSNLVTPHAPSHYVVRSTSSGIWTVGVGQYNTGVFRGYMTTFILVGIRKFRYRSWTATTFDQFVECTHYSGTYPSNYYTTYTPNNVSIPEGIIDRTFRTFKNFHKNWAWLPDAVEEVPHVWSDCVQECVDQARYVEVNTLSYVNELRDVTKMIPKLPLGKKAFSPKAWASAYLCLRYGFNLTVKDTVALRDGIVSAYQDSLKAKKMWSDSYAHRTSNTMLGVYPAFDNYRYKVSYSPIPNQLMEGVRLLDNWGLYPTLARDWDMIPASFVLDWFVKIQAYLAQLDTAMLIPYYEVLGVCWSRKVSVDVPASKVMLSELVVGQIRQTHYQRGIRKTLHPLDFRIERAGEFRNYWEALAMIVVSKK